MKTNTQFNSYKYIGLPAVIILIVIIFTIAILSLSGNVFINNDLTNVVTFTIEAGIGIFIAIIVYFVSKFQQLKTETIVNDIKSFNDTLNAQRNTMQKTFKQTILTCLKNLWKINNLILLNIRSKSLDETWIPENKILSDLIETYKKQILQYLEQLNSLGILSSPVLESEFISQLLILSQLLKDNIVQTGSFQATHPFSTNTQRIDEFVKKYFLSNIQEFSISEIEGYLDDNMKKMMKEARTNQSR